MASDSTGSGPTESDPVSSTMTRSRRTGSNTHTHNNNDDDRTRSSSPKQNTRGRKSRTRSSSQSNHFSSQETESSSQKGERESQKQQDDLSEWRQLLAKYTHRELQTICKEFGLTAIGKRDVLEERLSEHFQGKPTPTESDLQAAIEKRRRTRRHETEEDSSDDEHHAGGSGKMATSIAEETKDSESQDGSAMQQDGEDENEENGRPFSLFDGGRKEVVGLVVRVLPSGESKDGPDPSENYEFIPADELDQIYALEETEAENDVDLDQLDDQSEEKISSDSELSFEEARAGSMAHKLETDTSGAARAEPVESQTMIMQIMEQSPGSIVNPYRGIARQVNSMLLAVELAHFIVMYALNNSSASDSPASSEATSTIMHAILQSILTVAFWQRFVVYLSFFVCLPLVLALRFGLFRSPECVFASSIFRYVLNFLAQDIPQLKLLLGCVPRIFDVTCVVSILTAFWERQSDALIM